MVSLLQVEAVVAFGFTVYSSGSSLLFFFPPLPYSLSAQHRENIVFMSVLFTKISARQLFARTSAKILQLFFEERRHSGTRWQNQQVLWPFFFFLTQKWIFFFLLLWISLKIMCNFDWIDWLIDLMIPNQSITQIKLAWFDCSRGEKNGKKKKKRPKPALILPSWPWIMQPPWFLHNRSRVIEEKLATVSPCTLTTCSKWVLQP